MPNNVWNVLVKKGCLQAGTLIGVKYQRHAQVYNRFLINQVLDGDPIKIQAVHIQNNQTMTFEAEYISEIDGMALDRYLLHMDMNPDGTKIFNGKKRGRRPKNPPPDQY